MCKYEQCVRYMCVIAYTYASEYRCVLYHVCLHMCVYIYMMCVGSNVYVCVRTHRVTCVRKYHVCFDYNLGLSVPCIRHSFRVWKSSSYVIYVHH